MTITAFQRKILKISAYILGSLVAICLGFHFWFINHAEQLLEDLVEYRSNGKLKLKVKKFKFNWFSYDMQLRDAVFYSADTATASTAYRFGVEQLHVRVREILPLIFEKKIMIDSLSLVNPDIAVTRLRSVRNSDTVQYREASLPHEMGKVYNSIQDALKVLHVNRFQINNGKFTLINKIRAGQLPVTISNIYFHLENLQVDTSEATAKQKILFSDNVSLRSFDQDILFADGRHRLSFGNFHINILKKIIEFDSCTISATKGDSSKSSFSVFFDRLQMTNIDFDTLYKYEVIKADSVYCINPRFKLDVELAAKGSNKKSPPRLDELIQLLTGDMELGFVVVNNGSFDINTVRDGNPNSFTSDHNNFEMQGLRIDRDAVRPLSVKSFAMAIRNYENFLRDSTYAMEFDSILFVNNSVFLSNFSFKQTRNEKLLNSFTMPQFELIGLSWDDLVFDRKLSAEKATLYRPVINYTVANKSRSIFHTLSDLGRLIELKQLDMRNGQINVHFRDGADLTLQNADVSILSQDLLESDRMGRLQRSVRQLKFRKGTFKSKAVTVEMENADIYGETGKLSAASLRLRTKEKNLLINAKKVLVNRMTFDARSSISTIDGVKWDEAEVDLKALANQSANTDLTITRIDGGKTKLGLALGEQNLSTQLEYISADKISLPRKAAPQLVNLHAAGGDLSFNNTTAGLGIGRFILADRDASELESVRFHNKTTMDSASIVVPSVSFTPDLNSLINGKLVADHVSLKQPVFDIYKIYRLGAASNVPVKLPEVAIGNLSISNPTVSFNQTGDKDFALQWKGAKEKTDFFELKDLKVYNDPAPTISLSNSGFALNNFSITASGKTFATGTGNITARLTGIQLDRRSQDQWNWKAVIADLQVNNISTDNLGANHGRLDVHSAHISDLSLQSSTIFNLRRSLRESSSFRIKDVTGSFDNDKNHFDWKNLGFDKNSKLLSVDSFTYHPTPDRETFVAGLKYQTDYTTLGAGRVEAGPFDIDKYLADTVISAGTVNINRITMKTYRDKRKPARLDIIKPLPVNFIKNIPVHLSLDTLNLHNTNIDYTELNDKTGQTGTITIRRMKGRIFRMSNYQLRPLDSLTLDAEGYLMDSMRMSLRVKESYSDSLAGFLLSASAGSADARILNPVLVPLISAKLKSGFLDTMTMQVTGKEYVSLGEMKMFYHDLKVNILKGGVEGKKSFASGLINFLANSFVIKNSNRSRIGTVFFERLRNKSTLNYLVKITLSGVSSSAGIKKSKKELRKYKKR